MEWQDLIHLTAAYDNHNTQLLTANPKCSGQTN